MGPAAFEVESIAEDVELVAVKGELDLSNAFEFRRRVEAGLRSRGSAVVVDLSGVTHMDSSGLAALIDAHQAVQERRGRLALVVSSEPVRRTIEVRGLDRVFRILPTRDEAAAPRSWPTWLAFDRSISPLRRDHDIVAGHVEL